MSIKEDKRGIFTTIGAYTSFMENLKLPEQQDAFTSISQTKNDVVAFMMDVIKSIVGTDGLKETMGKLFTDFTDNAEPQLKTALRNQFIQFNAGDSISSTQFNTTGARIKANKIDIYGKFKTSGNASVDDLLHSTNVTSFDSQAYSAIVNAGTDVIYNNLLVKYDSATDEFIFKPNPAVAAQNATIGAWMGNYIDDAVIINKKDFLTQVMNSVYGTITANQKKSVEQIYQELQVAMLLEKLINGDDSLELTQEDFDELLQKAKDLEKGIIYYDMGCGMVGATLSLSGFTNFIAQVSGMTDSFTAGNAAAATIDESMKNTPEIAAENKQTVRDGFFKRLINAFNLALTQLTTTSPQVMALQAIMSLIQNGAIQVSNTLETIKKNKVFIKCMVQEAIKMISEFIFNIAVAYLIAWLTPIIKRLTQEKIIQYLGILKALI
jgi:hypothetical protein